MHLWIAVWTYTFILLCSLASSDEEWQLASQPSTSKQVVCPPATRSTPHTSMTPAPSAGDSVSPQTCSMQSRGRSHSVKGTKRPASVMSVDGDTERWNDCSVEDKVPALTNFHPKQIPGAQLVMDMICSHFQLFFTGSLVDTAVKNTNAFGRMRSEAGKHFLLKAQELYLYIALVVYMGLLGAKNIIEYWSGK